MELCVRDGFSQKLPVDGACLQVAPELHRIIVWIPCINHNIVIQHARCRCWADPFLYCGSECLDERCWSADVCKYEFAEIEGVVWINEVVEPLDEGFVHSIFIMGSFVNDGKDIVCVSTRSRVGYRCVKWAVAWVGTPLRVRCTWIESPYDYIKDNVQFAQGLSWGTVFFALYQLLKDA